jgi:hypothetical protein
MGSGSFGFLALQLAFPLPECLEKRVASASVRDGISAAAVVYAPDYGSEDNH